MLPVRTNETLIVVPSRPYCQTITNFARHSAANLPGSARIELAGHQVIMKGTMLNIRLRGLKFASPLSFGKKDLQQAVLVFPLGFFPKSAIFTVSLVLVYPTTKKAKKRELDVLFEYDKE